MKTSTATLVVGTIVFVVTVAAVVVLQVTAHPTDQLLTLAGPVVAALLITGRIDHHADTEQTKLDRITAQTNGVLDQRIKSGTTAALKDAGLVDGD